MKMTMTEDGCERREDVPKIVASIIATVPSIMLRCGFTYLRMKRRVRKNARVIEREMMASGMPEHVAKRLSMRYEEDSKLIETMIRLVTSKGSRRKSCAASDNHTGN